MGTVIFSHCKLILIINWMCLSCHSLGFIFSPDDRLDASKHFIFLVGNTFSWYTLIFKQSPYFQFLNTTISIPPQKSTAHVRADPRASVQKNAVIPHWKTLPRQDVKFPLFGTHDTCLENALNESTMTLFKVACHLVGFLLKNVFCTAEVSTSKTKSDSEKMSQLLQSNVFIFVEYCYCATGDKILYLSIKTDQL